MVDEFAYAGAEHLDPGFVAGFDRKQGYPDPAGDLAVLREHGIGRASTVVDLGAGTGRFALAAAAQVTRVVAVDVSPAMLAVLAERAARAGVANVECVRAGFLSYEHRRARGCGVHAQCCVAADLPLACDATCRQARSTVARRVPLRCRLDLRPGWQARLPRDHGRPRRDGRRRQDRAAAGRSVQPTQRHVAPE
jgi:SAM-dependent methyltransferase